MNDVDAVGARYLASLLKTVLPFQVAILLWAIFFGGQLLKTYSVELGMILTVVALVRVNFYDSKIYTREKFEKCAILWGAETSAETVIKGIFVILFVSLPVVLLKVTGLFI